MYITHKILFSSLSALVLTLQVCIPSQVQAAKKGQKDMDEALSSSAAAAAAAVAHSAPQVPDSISFRRGHSTKMTVAQLCTFKANRRGGEGVRYEFSLGQRRFRMRNLQVAPDLLELLHPTAHVTFTWDAQKEAWRASVPVADGINCEAGEDLSSTAYQGRYNVIFSSILNLQPQDQPRVRSNYFTIREVVAAAAVASSSSAPSSGGGKNHKDSASSKGSSSGKAEVDSKAHFKSTEKGKK